MIVEEDIESDEEDEQEQEELDDEISNEQNNHSKISEDGRVLEFEFNQAVSPRRTSNIKIDKVLPRTSLEHMRIKKIESSSESNSDKDEQLIEEIKQAALKEEGTMAFGSVANDEIPKI